MDIKHLVVSGAAYNGINIIGALYQAESANLIDYKNIQSVYGTSAGALALAIWILRFDKDVVYDYIIGRPWDKTYKFEPNILLGLIEDKGILGQNIISEIFVPLLKSKDISQNITLGEIYDITNIEFHVYATAANGLESLDFSYITHHEVKLLDCIYMSCSLPLIFKPMYYNDSYIVDGGLTYFFPTKPCIENGSKKENILGIKVCRPGTYNIPKDSNTIEYISFLLNNVTRRLSILVESDIPNIIVCNVPPLGSELRDTIVKESKRKEMLEDGEKAVTQFLQCSVQELA